MLAPSLSPNRQSVTSIPSATSRLREQRTHNQSIPRAEGYLPSTLRFAMAALLLPQLPTLIWCLQTHSFIYLRGWVNLEYLVALGVAVAFPGWATLVLATLEMCLALIEPLAHLYYFHVSDLMSSLRYLMFLPVGRLSEYACLLFAYAAVTLLALRLLVGGHRQPRARHMVYFLAVFGLLAVAADVGQGRFARFLNRGPEWGDADVRPSKIIRMPMGSLAYALYHFSGEGAALPRASLPLASALSQAMTVVPGASQPDVVLVLTESWGLATDRRITEAQTEAYRSSALRKLYRVQTGQTRFDGSTTAGETRELCGNSAGHVSLSYPDSYFAECWPSRFKQKGYVTLAVHGFAPTMFRRRDWYRRFGFDEEIFQPELQLAGAATCGGAFPGICDDDVARWIGRSLLENPDQRPRFVHWVTLNSHLPVTATDGDSSEHDCIATGIEREQSLCAWFLLVRRVHESVTRLAETPGLRPTVFVIVGDHAPPFMRPGLRDRFSQTDVPYVVLVPRSYKGPSDR